MTSTSTERRALVICEAAGEGFALDVSAVERVLQYSAPRHVPNTAPWLTGVLDVGSRLVPVLELRERLGLPGAARGDDARIVVAALAEGPVGLVVDRVHEVTAVDPAAVEAAPAVYRGLTREFVQGLVRRGERVFVLLDVERLVTSTERLAMRDLLVEETKNG